MISLGEVKKLAELARIEVSDAEARTLAKDMEQILGYVEQVRNIAEISRGIPEEGLVNVMREDIAPHESGVYTSTLVSAAPETESGFVKVPKIL